jgi:phage terminase small subunit
VAACEAAIARHGPAAPLRTYEADAATGAALRVAALAAWREVLQTLETRGLTKAQRDFDPVQVLVVGHSVYLQAMAVVAAEQRLCPPDQVAAVRDRTLRPADAISIARRTCTVCATY